MDICSSGDQIFFVFVNPSSGGNQASCFTRPKVEMMRFSNPPSIIHVYNIVEGSSGDKRGFKLLKEVVDSICNSNAHEPNGDIKRVRVLAAGGDGTVMWTIEECGKHGIIMDRIIIGVVPYGTGNDFSRALNWHTLSVKRVFDPGMKDLRRLMQLWNFSKRGVFDIWSIDLELLAGGRMLKINGRTREKEVVEVSSVSGRKIFSKPMANYFSVGIESRIGMGFDRHRVKSQLGNKMVYALEGMKKICCAKVDDVSDFVHSLVEMEETAPIHSNLIGTDNRTTRATAHETRYPTPAAPTALQNIESHSSHHTTSTIKEPTPLHQTQLKPSRFVFVNDFSNDHGSPSFDFAQLSDSERREVPKLKAACSLIAVNIASFAGGCDIWGASKGKVGLELDQRASPTSKQKLDVLKSSAMDNGDGKLEWMTFPSAASLGMEHVFKGRGSRVDQGSGPYEINFKKDVVGNPQRVYMQIDGEFFQIEDPARLVLRRLQQVNVLVQPNRKEIKQMVKQHSQDA